ncbi:multidrug effflux MFS transporter [Rickettsiaceae bacterium]|nr:multidrug effflux MFS transporter [Rickettsiaceae bacterium]
MTHSRAILLTILVMSAGLAQFAADIYAPSIPAISNNLHTRIDDVQWSMSIYMFGITFSQLIYGPLSEGIGRKPPMIFGLFVMLIGSIMCFVAPNADALIGGRLVQGIGAGAGACLWRSSFRDIFSGKELAIYTSYLVIIVMFVIPTAPLVGGYLQQYFGWRASFLFMTTYSVIALLFTIFGLSETSASYHKSKLKLGFALGEYMTLLRSPVFVGMTCGTFLNYGAFFSWFVIGPVLLIKELGFSPIQFGWITFIAGIISYGLAGILNDIFVKKYGMPAMLRFGWIVMILSGALMLLGCYITGINIWSVMIPILLLFFGSSFIWPNAFAIAFTPFGNIAGHAGALYGSMQVCGAAVFAAAASYPQKDNQILLALIIFISSILSWIIYEAFVHDKIKD